MKQVYTERKGDDYVYDGEPARWVEVTAFETDRNDPELLPPLIHVRCFNRGRMAALDKWQLHDGLRGAEIIRKAILAFDEQVAIYFPSEEGVESH